MADLTKLSHASKACRPAGGHDQHIKDAFDARFGTAWGRRWPSTSSKTRPTRIARTLPFSLTKMDGTTVTIKNY